MPENINLENNQTEQLSNEDINLIQEALSHKGISIKDLVSEYKSFKAGQDVIVKEAKPTKKNYSSKPDVSFELVTCDYPDFCIRRKTAKTEKLLVVMVSCGGFFIKNVKKNSKGEEVEVNREPLTRENYAQFTSGMGDIELEDFWLPCIYSGVGFYDKYIDSYLSREIVREMIKKHCAPEINGWNGSVRNEEIEAYKTVPNLFREFYNQPIAREFIIRGLEFITEIQKTYSLEKARIFLNRLIESNLKNIDGSEWITTAYEEKYYRENEYVDDDDDEDYEYYSDENAYNRFASKNGSEMVSYRPNIEMDFDKMCDYILVQSVRMGYRKHMDRFFNEWNDCLRMQHNLSKKITNKYPAALSTYHMCLSCDYEDAKIKIDEELLKQHTKHTSKFEANIDDYIFICPKSKEEILDEAQQQSNCLASYVEKYAHGRCMLFFMRKKKTPQTSLVTIEVVNGHITQKYQAQNRNCTEEQNAVIEKWFEKMFNKKSKSE